MYGRRLACEVDPAQVIANLFHQLPPKAVIIRFNMVAKKDFNAPKHEELDVPNLEVIKVLQSLNSRSLQRP